MRKDLLQGVAPWFAGLVLMLLTESAGATWTEVATGEMKARVRWHGAILVGEVSAPTSGWIAIGFNRRPGLAGTHFLMMAPSASDYRAADLQGVNIDLEEHVASPPTHAAVSTQAKVLDSWAVGGRRTILFAWPRPNGIAPCKAASPGEMMLAFSVSPDFDHHSRMRKHLRAPLCATASTTNPAALGASETLTAALLAYDEGHTKGTNFEHVLFKTMELEDLVGHGKDQVSASTFAKRARAAAIAGSSAVTTLAVTDGETAVATADVSLPKRTVSDVLVFRAVNSPTDAPRPGVRWRLTHKYYRVHKKHASVTE